MSSPLHKEHEKKVNNLETLIATPTCSQKLASRIIRKTADDDCLSVLRRSIESSQPALKRLFTVDNMCLIRKDLDPSTSKTSVLAQDLPVATNQSNQNLCFHQEIKIKKVVIKKS